MRSKGVLFVITCLLLPLVIAGCGSDEKKKAEEVVSNYLAAWQRGDAARMYDLHKLGTALGKNEMMARFSEFPVIPISFSVKTTEIDGNDATVTAEVRLPDREKVAARIKSASEKISEQDISTREKRQRLGQQIVNILESMPQDDYSMQTGTFTLVKEVQDWKITKVEGLLHFTTSVDELLN